MKTMRKILMAALTLVMVLGMSVSVFAAQVIPSVSKISAPKSATVWTNATGEQAITATFVYAGDASMADLTAVPKDRGIVNVKAINKTDGTDGKKYVSVVLDPIKNGKTTVTIYDKNKTKVKATTTVTVKTYAEDIAFAPTSSVNIAEDKSASVAIVANGKLNLGAVVSNADASNKGLKYTKVSGGKAITVDKKGNVSVAKNAVAGDTAVIKVIAADNANLSKEINVNVKANAVTGNISFMKESNSKNLVYGMLNKKNTVGMKTNPGSECKTYQLVNTNKTLPSEDLLFTSSNTAVATVDAKTGLIKAIGDGKAVINVTSKSGAKVSAKINVTVTTDVEVLNLTTSKDVILANNKDAAVLKLSSNSAAGAKAAKYSVTAAGVATKSASVDKKGNFKAKAPGTYTVMAKSGDVTSVVVIEAKVPTTSITVSGTGVNKGKLNIEIKSQAKGEYPLTAVNDGDIKDFEWSSSNTNVVTVENGVIKPVANGKAKVTVKALDGTNKAASVNVTVTTKAYEITSDRVVKDGDVNVVYVASKTKTQTVSGSTIVGVDTSINLATEVAAKTNADASNKTVKYFKDGKVVTTVVVPEEGVKVIAKNNDEDVSYEVLIKKLVPDQIAKEFTIALNDKDIKTEVKVGDTLDASAKVDVKEGIDGKVATNLSLVNYASSNAKILSVDKSGNVVAKGTGTATITASFKNPYTNEVKTAPITIMVGSKDATIKTALDSTFASVLKEENRDWTGVKTTFDAKKASFVFNVLNPNQNVTELQNTGLTPSAVAACLALDAKKMSIQSITVCDESGEEIDTIDRAAVLADGLNASLRTIITKAIGDNTALVNWVGTNYTIKITTLDNVYPTSGIRHEVVYDAVVTMSDALQKEIADVNIQAAIENATLPDGIESVDYNAATRTAVVNVNDPSVTFADAKATRDDVVNSLAGAFDGVSFVDYAITIPGAGTYTSSVADNDGNKPVEVIKSLLDSYTDKLAQKGIYTYAEADGTVATAQVTYMVGNMSFTRDYSIVFAIDKNIIAPIVDRAIAANYGDANTALKDKAVIDTPVAGSNVITVGILDSSVTKVQLAATPGLNGVTKKFVQDAMVDTTAVGTAMIDGKTVTLTKDDYDLGMAFSLLNKFGIETLGDIAGKTAYVKFPVKVGNTTVTVAYQVEFEDRTVAATSELSEEGLDAVSEDAANEDEAVVEEITEEIVDEVVTEEINDEAAEEVITEEADAEEAEEVVEAEEEVTEE